MSNIGSVVASRLHLQPALIAPSHVTTVSNTLQMLQKADADQEKSREFDHRSNMMMAFGFDGSSHEKPFAFANGTAVIPVTGTLINRFGRSWGDWVTGYNFIRSQLNAALGDPDVENIVFDVNSPGGEVAGCFELCDDIFDARGQKPMLAVVDSCCYSAAYAIGSSVGKIVVAPSGGVGSIGCVSMHVSYQKMFEQEGIEVTYIFAGDHKVDGNPCEALPDDVKAQIQAGVEQTRQKFAELVARNRGLDLQVVIDTEAQCYRADEALALGLVDAVLPPSKALTILQTAQSAQTTLEISMSNPATGAETAQVDVAAATSAAAQQARVDERQRISAINALPEAAGRSALASHIALNTDMSVDAAKGILAAAPVEKQEAASPTGNPFEAAMGATANPQVGIGAEAESGAGAGGENVTTGILAAYAAATGRKLN